MKKLLGLLTLGILLSTSAFADSYTNLQYPSAVWDSTTATLYALGIPGKGTSGRTIIPSAGVATTWTAPQTFNALTTLNSGLAGPAPRACGATCALAATDSFKTILLNTAAGSVATLPTATGTGNIYRFVVSTAVTSNADKVLLATVTDSIIGTAVGQNANTAKVFVGSATVHSLQMPFAGTQPSGGFLGDSYMCQDIAAGIYECNGNYSAGVTPTTPFSASTT